MPLIIPKKLRALVESYVMSHKRGEEKGGFLMGRENTILSFLPVPNYSSDSHTSTYFINPSATRSIADEVAAMVGGKVLGDVHTHPDGTVPSEQDGRYVRGLSWPYHVIVADHGDRFEWYCVDNSFRGVLLTETDQELEGMMELVAGELSMFDMGRFFVTPKGELLSTKKEALPLIEVDPDVLAVWRWGKDMNAYYVNAAACSRATKIPYPRVRKAFKKLDWGKR